MLHAIVTRVLISSYRPEKPSPSSFAKRKLQKKKKNQVKKVEVEFASIPAFPEQHAWLAAERPGARQNTASSSLVCSPFTQRFWHTFADSKWPRDDESALNKCEPLPLPMTYPGSTPAVQDVESMKNCDPEIKDCRDVIYQWTGECFRCQGAGEARYQRKSGREIICKCITCLGLGHVHKVTLRTDIDIVEEVESTS